MNESENIRYVPQLLGASSRTDRLPAETLNKATPEYIWRAVQLLLAGDATHSFGPSTDYDLIADDGQRLPPKAVFGVALSMALAGAKIEPKHFTAGDSSVCFRLLRAAGYEVVLKGEPGADRDPEVNVDEGWTEGKPKLVAHVKRERGYGISRAKKAEQRRLHGRLFCERCKLDPVEHYKTKEAEACIEVHHAATHVSEMSEGHITTLDDLQCLCANCHRLLHALLRAE
jgi:5-methylcytosine-specific restriction protein A